ncbi:hypothetical protein E2C01_083332 [Portunus trituberculatus]|uniref:Uncharacterized protein n=1 Tax=Portunus trituberculatus TaxID=210409 RepID=A0A5B7IUV5_PORTR|nr:hypothetical protein [Portunus trituberculatus]
MTFSHSLQKTPYTSLPSPVTPGNTTSAPTGPRVPLGKLGGIMIWKSNERSGNDPSIISPSLPTRHQEEGKAGEGRGRQGKEGGELEEEDKNK